MSNSLGGLQLCTENLTDPIGTLVRFLYHIPLFLGSVLQMVSDTHSGAKLSDPRQSVSVAEIGRDIVYHPAALYRTGTLYLVYLEHRAYTV